MHFNNKFIFWGTGPMAESMFINLYKNNLIPKYLITKPDAKYGRKQIITSPTIKTLADTKNIKVLQPNNIKEEVFAKKNKNYNSEFDKAINDPDIKFHIVASYGKIIPKYILDLLNKNNLSVPMINIHPSNLPDLRGPSPIQYALLRGDKNITISIIKMDEEMDHGDIILREILTINHKDCFDDILKKVGENASKMIVENINDYINGNIKTTQQNHQDATFCKFINKEQGDISDLIFDIDKNITNIKLLEIKNKWRAFNSWPGIYFFINDINKPNNVRVKITSFDLEENSIELCIKKVIIEGKKEISFTDFIKKYKK